MNLSVIIPIYNEAESIAPLMERLIPVVEQYGPFEVLCIDDGSDDGTFEELLKAKQQYPQVRIIKLKVNSGKSDALDAGFHQAQGDIVVTLDADLQDPPEDIRLLMENLNGTDAVIGWRHDRKDTVVKNFASKFANGFRNFFLHDDAHDTCCSLKALRKKTIGTLIMYKGMHRFVPALLKMHGFSIKEVKVSHHKRERGKSKYGTFARTFPAFFDLVGVIWMKKRKLTYEVEKVI